MVGWLVVWGQTKYINDVSELTFHYANLSALTSAALMHSECSSENTWFKPFIRAINLRTNGCQYVARQSISIRSADRRFQLISSIDFNTHQTSTSAKEKQNGEPIDYGHSRASLCALCHRQRQ